MRVKVTALMLAASLSAAANAAEGNWARVGEALGKTGTELPGGIYRVALPRTDLKVTLDGVDIKPGLALGGWRAFEKAGSDGMVMGDLVLTMDEVDPVMSKLLAGGIAVTAPHNHLLRNQPFTMYMHVQGMDDPVTLAGVVHAALAESKTPFPAAGQPAADLAGGTLRLIPTGALAANFPMAIDAADGRILVAFRSPPMLAAYTIQDGQLAARLPICADADDLFVDARRHRIYVSCGAGVVDVLENSETGYARLARIPTASGARTSLFVPELDRLYVAARAGWSEPAAIWVFRPMP